MSSSLDTPRPPPPDAPTSDGRPDETHGLRYPCGAPPAPGQFVEIKPGVLWLRMPLPFALNHINLWAIADEDERGPGWAIVDTGTKTPEVLAAWRSLLADDGPLAATPQGARVTRVLVTHMHPDHVGMAGWLTRQCNVALWMARLEYLTCRTLAADTGREAPDDAIRFYRQVGWPEAALDVYRTKDGVRSCLLPPCLSCAAISLLTLETDSPSSRARCRDRRRLRIPGEGDGTCAAWLLRLEAKGKT